MPAKAGIFNKTAKSKSKESRRMAGFFRYINTLSGHANFGQLATLLDQVDAGPVELGEKSLLKGSPSGNIDKSHIAALYIEHQHIPARKRQTDIPNSRDVLTIVINNITTI